MPLIGSRNAMRTATPPTTPPLGQVIDSLTSIDTRKALSANQGRVLAEIIDIERGGVDAVVKYEEALI